MFLRFVKMHKEEKAVNVRCEFSDGRCFLILRIHSSPRNHVSCDPLCMDGYLHCDIWLFVCLSFLALFAYGQYFQIVLPFHEPQTDL